MEFIVIFGIIGSLFQIIILFLLVRLVRAAEYAVRAWQDVAAHIVDRPQDS